MKKPLFVFMACLALLVTVMGCTTTTTTFPLVYTHSPNTEFEILGTVFLRSPVSVGYNTVFEAAARQFPATDFVIDIMIDRHEITTSYHWVAMAFRLIFSPNIRQQDTRYEYTIRGTAIRYTQPNLPPQIRSNPETPAGTAAPVNAAPPASASVSGRFTAASVNGRVQIQRHVGDNWHDVRAGDIVNNDFRVRTAAGSSLVLTSGAMTVIIPGSVEGRISSLVEMFAR